MPNDIPEILQTAIEQEELSTRMLVTLYLDDYTYRFVANDTDKVMADTDGDGLKEEFIPAQIERSEIESAMDGKSEKLTLTLSNKWQEWAAIMAHIGNKINLRKCRIHEYFPDYPDEDPVEIFSGLMNSPKMNVGAFVIDIIRSMGDYKSDSPNMTYDPNCQWMFKDGRCLYGGGESYCDKTLTRCLQLGNVENFGGHPSVPREMVIKSA